MTIEEWRPIPGYEGIYQVSDLGRIRSLPRRGTLGGIRKVRLRPDGYYDVELSRDSVKAKLLLHRLIAAAFCPRAEGQAVVRHLNDNRDDNRVVNLAWGTDSDNVADAIRNGRHPHVNKTHCNEGHPYDETNTYYDARGHRSCKECGRAASRKWARRIRSAA